MKDSKRSFRLDAKDLRGLFIRAARQGRMAVMLVYFSDMDLTAEIRLLPGGRELITET